MTSIDWTLWPLDRVSLGTHEVAWNRLWLRLPLRHPMLHGRFVNMLLKHWGTGLEKLGILGPLDDPCAMVIVKRNGSGSWQLFLPSQSQVGIALLQNIDQMHSLMHKLPGCVTTLDLMAIDPAVVPTDFSLDRPIEIMPYTYTLSVHLKGSFEDYWQRRPKKLRENIRRNLVEAYERLGKLEYRWLEDPNEIEGAVERYAELESQGWKARDRTAIKPGDAQAHFYTQLLQQHGVVAEMWAGGRLLASRLLWAPPQGPVVALKTTYSESHKSAGLGRLLLQWTLKRAHHHWPGQRLEFCTDARGDLLAWSDEQRHVNHLTLYRSDVVRGFRNAVQAVARTVSPPSAPPVRTGGSNDLGLSAYRSVEHLPPIAAKLLEKGEIRSVQLGFDWLITLEETVYTGLEAPYYFVLTQGTEALAVWPLLGLGHEGGKGLRSMANYYCAITGPVVQPWCKPIQMVALIQFMVRTLEPAYRLQLYPLDPNEHATHLVRAALRMTGFGVFGYFGFRNWIAQDDHTWQAYLGKRSVNSRSNIRRARKKFTEAGGRIEIITTPSDVERGMSAYEQVYACSWKPPEPYPHFFRELSKRLALRGQLRLGIAWLEQKPVAATLWSVAHGTAEIHKLAYDLDHRSLSVGTALSAALVEHVLDHDRVHKIDYLIGDDEYKQQWMTKSQERWGFIAGRVHHPLGALLVMIEGLRRLVKRSISWDELTGSRLHTTTRRRGRLLRLSLIIAVVLGI